MSKRLCVYSTALLMSHTLWSGVPAQAASSGNRTAVRQTEASGLALKSTDNLPSATVQSETDGVEAAGDAGQGASRLQLGGYVKSIAINSQTLDAESDAYFLSLNRLRLKLSYELSARVKVHVEHDTEVRVGSYLNTAEFRRQKNAPPTQYWGDGSVIADRNGYYATQRLFRAYVRFSGDATDITLGRQRVALGTGRFWSALDMLNPVNPVQVERDEYVGVDAALLEYKIGELSRISLVGAPDPANVSDRVIAQLRTHSGNTDWTFTNGKYGVDRVVGLDFATQIGDAGLHGEWTHTVPPYGSPYTKAVIGLDYVFPNTLAISAEAYVSGQPKEERLAQFAQNPQLAQLQPFSSRYAGISVGYEFTPLFKTTTYLLYNLSDHGRFISPTLTYSISGNATVSGGLQFYYGSDGSDFGNGRNVGYIQLQLYY